MHSYSVEMFTVKGNAHRSDEEAGVFIGGGSCVDDDVDAGDHFGWISRIEGGSLLA